MHPSNLPPSVRPRHRKKRRKSFLLNAIGFMFAAGVTGVIAVSAAAGYFIWQASQELPSYENLANYEPPVMTRIHAHDGQLIAEYARERRIFVPINTVPKTVIAAFLSAEDKRFFEHGGLDWDHVIAEQSAKGVDSLWERASGISTLPRLILIDRADQIGTQRRVDPGRINHYAAGCEELFADERTNLRPQTQGSDPGDPDRAGLRERQNPRAVS